MKIRIVFGIIIVMVNLAGAIAVYILDEQYSQTNQTVLRFKIENNFSDTLNGIEIRYLAIRDASIIAESDLYYLPGGMADSSFEYSEKPSLEIYFSNIVLIHLAGFQDVRWDFTIRIGPLG